MPQIFQVLRCYKCLVFQIHQTKKSNKYQCKMCGEKQSIKRHYGLGNGQECRLHVQKLNALRGKTEEEILCKKDEDSEEEFENEQNKIVHTVSKFDANKSKWSTYVDGNDITQNESDIMDLKDEKLYSQNSLKRKKCDGLTKKHLFLPQEPSVNEKVFETPFKYKCIDEANSTKRKQSKQKFSQDIPREINHTILKANNVQGRVQRKSKWAEFVEHNKILERNETHCSENKDIIKTQQGSSNYGQMFFELSDDNDLDAILNI